MGAVPQKVLNWMYNVLRGEYHDPDRTYSDAAQTLSQHPNLSVRTSIYTYENGRSSLLLNISGVIPTTFRDTTYMFPISVWIPHEYPKGVPIGFATPTKNMVIRAGQHVSGEGRIYHPYLAGWRADNSNLLQFVSIIQQIFAREPPLIAKQEQGPLPSPRQILNPPSIPPLPPEIARPGSGAFSISQPPPPPPKTYESHPRSASQQSGGPPPVPPRPSQGSEYIGAGDERTANAYGKPPPPPPGVATQRSSSLRHSFSPEPLDYRGSPSIQRNTRQQSRDDGINPVEYHNMTQSNHPQRPQPQHSDWGSSLSPNGSASNPLQRAPQLPLQPPQPQSNPPFHQQQSFPQRHRNSFEQHLPQQTQPPQPTSQPKKPPPTDLLTSTFDAPLPLSTPQPTTSAPPIPPNPQKDALLSHLSSTLTSLASNMHTSNTSALPLLSAQQRALTSTLTAINAELTSLTSLSTLLSTNEQILHSSMAAADAVLADAKTRSVPDIDAVLVAPTRVEGQLYEVVCEERAIRETRAFLGRCVDKGRVGGEVWARQTRGLAREEFGRMWLGRKIARGLGLRGVDGESGGGEGGGGRGEGWYR